MAVAQTGGHEEQIGGASRRLLLRNGEIERFEIQYTPFGMFQLWDQLFGHGQPPQIRHVRDLIALALVGGGMSDRAADDLISGLPPSENFALRSIAQRVLGATFVPSVLDAPSKKKTGAGSRGTRPQAEPITTPDPES